MALEAAFKELHATVEALNGSLDNVLWAVLQAQPEEEPGHALVDHYDAVIHDLLGWVAEAKEAAQQGRQAAGVPRDLPGMQRALTICHDRFNRLWSRFYVDLVSFEWIDGLNDLARERGGEWANWVNGVKDGLDQCTQPMYDIGQALFPCWRDLSEQASLIAISVQATSTGAVKLARNKGGKRPARQ